VNGVNGDLVIEYAVVSGRLNVSMGSFLTNQMSSSSKADNLIARFRSLTIFNRPDTYSKVDLEAEIT
jgi:hypothetical protein